MTNQMTLTCAAAFLAAAACATTPAVSSVQYSQAADRSATVSYTLSGGPAIITLDVTTNGVSIGGKNLRRVAGDVNRLVTPGSRTIKWDADYAWADQNDAALLTADIVVKAWPLDDPPDWFVANLAKGGTNSWYASVDELPGGLLDNPTYRTTSIVMRRIHAAGVPWTMGSISEPGRFANEVPHTVTMTNDYYIGVFPVTYAQWSVVTGMKVPGEGSYIDSGAYGKTYTREGWREMRPVENVAFGCVRENSCDNVQPNAATYGWPNPPHTSSFLGLLRSITKIDFDLPGEAQWEYACRAGHGEGRWGDGSACTNDTADASLNVLARYVSNGGADPVEGDENYGKGRNLWTTANGTAVVGSHAPNSWGIYDMHGNVWEICLDWYEADISSLSKGEINAAGATTATGNTVTKRVMRGGNFSTAARFCRPAYRIDCTPDWPNHKTGFRLVCPVNF